LGGFLALSVAALPTAAEETSQAERVAVGDPAPAVSLAAPDGTTFRSSDLLDKKSLVLVFFRGAW
jgi:cytochrome oxidase Cu insertion factor (SCO1/SenC/PrrC family)